MKIVIATCVSLAAVLLAPAINTSAYAQSTGPKTDQADKQDKAEPAKPSKAGPDSVVILFGRGISSLQASDNATLDKVSRLYNEGKPIVMMLTGSSDRTGSAQANLLLSQRRATAVLNGLLNRGIPAERFQVIAKGETEPAVPTAEGVQEARNRRVEITWR